MVTAANARGISVSQSVDRTETPFESPVTLEVVLRWEGPQSAYLFDKPLNPTLDRLKVTGFVSSISSSDSPDGEVTTKRFTFTLHPTRSGIGSIEPIVISYLSWPDSLPGELMTEPMTVRIAEPLPLEKKTDGGFPWWPAALPVVVVLVIVLVVRRGRRRQPTPTIVTPRERFLERLTDLKKEAGSDLKTFQARLYGLLVEFLQSQYGVDFGEETEEELTAAVESTSLSEGRKAALKEWLIAARRDKFRPVVAAPGEAIRLEASIRSFFEKL